MVKKEYPPNFERIQKAFRSYTFDNSQMIYAYWPDIYNPDGVHIPKDTMAHELVHLERQENNPEAWWDKYLTNANFRLEEELAAYREQYRFAKTIIKDRNKLALGLMKIAHCLASSMYGNLLSINEAIKAIEQIKQ